MRHRKSKIEAQEDEEKAPGALREYGLAYCKRYLTTPGKYLSYVKWDKATTLAAVSRIESPITVVLGGNDKRISTEWADTLKKMDLDIVEIAGANHFFDHQYEFDLLESIELILSRIGT